MLHFSDVIPDRKRRRDYQDDGRHALAQCRTGCDNSWVLCRPASPGLHVLN